MSTVNIAIIGGVVLLILVLLKMRRANAADSPAPSRGRTRGERRRKRGKDAPPAPPEPMPLAAAAGQSAATAGPPPMSPPVAEWPPADEPAPDLWPVEAEAEAEAGPVEWPPADDAPPVADAAPESDPAGAPAAWPEDEIVTEPGWPLPGEVDVAWSPPAGADGIGMVPPTVAPVAAATAPAWEDETAATEAPPSLEWLSAEPAGEAPAWTPVDAESDPVWAPSAEVAEDVEEGFTWGAPAAAEPVEEALAWEPPPAAEPVEEALAWEPPPAVDAGWGDPPADLYDAQPTGEIPVIRTDEPAAHRDESPFGDAAPYVDAEDGASPEDHAAEAVSGYAYGPEPAAAPSEGFAHDHAPEPDYDPPVESVRPEPDFSPPVADVEADPESETAPMGGVDVEAGFATAPEAFVAPAPAPPAPSEPATAWWDEEPAPAREPVHAPAAGDDPSHTGRFALGGFAIQPGQQALGGVTFRVELPEAPGTWVVAAAPGGPAAPGTLSLVLDGAINCAAEGLEVVMDPGFAPTTQGFTVRVAALAAGPFAASGSFRVH